MPRGRRDANERQIIDAMLAVGATVHQLEDPDKAGLPDLVVGWIDVTGRKHDVLMEVKVPGGALNPKQRVFHATWKGPIVVVETPVQAVTCLGFDARRINRESRHPAQAGR